MQSSSSTEQGGPNEDCSSWTQHGKRRPGIPYGSRMGWLSLLISWGLLRLNPRMWMEHLTSQLSWTAAWLLLTCGNPAYLVVDELWPCVLWLLIIVLMEVLLTIFWHREYGFTYRELMLSGEWVWGLRKKVSCIASGKWNVSRVQLQRFDITYIML